MAGTARPAAKRSSSEVYVIGGDKDAKGNDGRVLYGVRKVGIGPKPGEVIPKKAPPQRAPPQKAPKAVSMAAVGAELAKAGQQAKRNAKKASASSADEAQWGKVFSMLDQINGHVLEIKSEMAKRRRLVEEQ